MATIFGDPGISLIRMGMDRMSSAIATGTPAEQVMEDNRRCHKGAAGEIELASILAELGDEVAVFPSYHLNRGDGTWANWDLDFLVVSAFGLHLLDAKAGHLGSSYGENASKVGRYADELRGYITKKSFGGLSGVPIIAGMILMDTERKETRPAAGGKCRDVPRNLVHRFIQEDAGASGMDFHSIRHVLTVLYESMRPEDQAKWASKRDTYVEALSAAEAGLQMTAWSPRPCPECGGGLLIRKAATRDGRGIPSAGSFFMGCTAFAGKAACECKLNPTEEFAPTAGPAPARPQRADRKAAPRPRAGAGAPGTPSTTGVAPGDACPDCLAAGRVGGVLMERKRGSMIGCSNWDRNGKGCHFFKERAVAAESVPHEIAPQPTGSGGCVVGSIMADGHVLDILWDGESHWVEGKPIARDRMPSLLAGYGGRMVNADVGLPLAPVEKAPTSTLAKSLGMSTAELNARLVGMGYLGAGHGKGKGDCLTDAGRAAGGEYWSAYSGYYKWPVGMVV